MECRDDSPHIVRPKGPRTWLGNSSQTINWSKACHHSHWHQTSSTASGSFPKLEVVTPEDQEKFDAMLEEAGKPFGNVAVLHDVGAFLGVAGRPLV